VPTLTPEQKRHDIFSDVFKKTLKEIEQHDLDYAHRYGLVLKALHYAHELGIPAGIRIDKDEPEWPVVYIELPTGQVSWHMPQHVVDWDGHDGEEKYKRVRDYVNSRRS
jgi:hypothetical protein